MNDFLRLVENKIKKNNDKNINLILLRKIGLTTQPNMCKISSIELKKKFNKII